MSTSAATPSGNSLFRFLGLGLALITLLVYLPVRQNGFVRIDDAIYLTSNLEVQGGLSRSSLVWAFTSFYAANWHPLTWVSHMLDCQLFGADAGAHHMVSVLFHLVNAVLFFLFWYRTTRAIWPAAISAALFAWHPLHVESVAWASERKDVLSTFFFGLILLAYHRYVTTSPKQASIGVTSLFRSARAWAVILLFALGLLAKPMLVTLPFVLLLLDGWPLNRFPPPVAKFQNLRALVLEKTPLFVLSLISCVLTYLAQRADAVVSLEQLPFSLRVGNALLSYARYLLKTFWPADLAVFYPLPASLNALDVLGAAVLLLGITIGVGWKFRSYPYLVVGWFWFLGTLVPVIGLLQVGEQAMADRYTYIPLVGIFTMLAYGGQELVARARVKRWVIISATSAVCAGCLFLTNKQVRYWRDSEVLFRHALQVTGVNAKAHEVLGFALAGKGRQEEAAQQLQRAVQLEPRLYAAHNDLAIILQSWGRTNAALEHYQAAVRGRPQNPVFQANLALLLVELGRFEEGVRHYAEALRLEPSNPRYYYLRGSAYQRAGRGAEALRDYREALRLAPDDTDLALDLCIMLAADPNAQIRNGAEAVALAERLNQTTRGEQGQVLDVLAMAYAEVGDFDRACGILTRMLGMIPPGTTNAFVGAVRARLKLYQAHQPYRENWNNAPHPQSPMSEPAH